MRLHASRPASGLLGHGYDDAARAAGMRWISVDKPGTGDSDPDRQASLPGYAADIGQLADQWHLRTGPGVAWGGGP
ncbi:hypothetical protein CFN78_25135 [Amycolatopsis antarctica]|uniref:Alpha/beta hydrolase n=1 Tax=Amycolatopsis antarctica TaxID=1854586 RepID=A0A263CWC8_9PSEU|nr:hypothetical protein [Amycolatopsis antarctica]OZM70450.1 hypothetical protein CFN78_25135 [Amycolatopsis antarctica]